MTDLLTRLTATVAFLQAHHHDAADVLEAIAVIERLTAERDGAYERAARVADDWPDNGISKQAVWRIAAAIRQLGRE